eukprot:UN30731
MYRVSSYLCIHNDYQYEHFIPPDSPRELIPLPPRNNTDQTCESTDVHNNIIDETTPWHTYCYGDSSERFHDLKDWILLNGGLTKNISIHNFNNNIRGIRAEENINPGELISYLPKILEINTVWILENFGNTLLDNLNKDDFSILAFWLLYETYHIQTSPWKP